MILDGVEQAIAKVDMDIAKVQRKQSALDQRKTKLQEQQAKRDARLVKRAQKATESLTKAEPTVGTKRSRPVTEEKRFKRSPLDISSLSSRQIQAKLDKARAQMAAYEASTDLSGN